MVECLDVSQNVADCADDIVPLQDIRSHLKSRNLFRFAAFQTPQSNYTMEYDETTDLRLDVSITSMTACELQQHTILLFSPKLG